MHFSADRKEKLVMLGLVMVCCPLVIIFGDHEVEESFSPDPRNISDVFSAKFVSGPIRFPRSKSGFGLIVVQKDSDKKFLSVVVRMPFFAKKGDELFLRVYRYNSEKFSAHKIVLIENMNLKSLSALK
jgi:hypothetical protein